MATQDDKETDLELIVDKGTQCGSCHRRIRIKGGVVFGRSSLFYPAIYVCRDCVKVAMDLLNPVGTLTLREAIELDLTNCKPRLQKRRK
jgi:hypothetical protein